MYYSIFTVFFNLAKTKQVPVKIAKHLKVPYACNVLNFWGMQCKPYKNMHDSLYYVRTQHCRTYFYTKNDLILYDRRLNFEAAIFMYELLEGSHETIKLSKLRGIVRDEDAFFITINDNIRFVVSSETQLQDQKKYVTVISLSDGHFLLKATKENEIYLRFLSIFHNVMLPLIQVKENGIFVYLVDLFNESSYSISWHLNDIKNLINAAVKEDEAPKSYRRIKQTILYDTITAIKDFDIKSLDNYSTNKDSSDFKYLKIVFNLKVEGEEYKYDLSDLFINIEINSNRLSSILHFSRRNSELQVSKKSITRHIVYSVESTLSSLSHLSSLVRIHNLNKKLNNETSTIEIKIKKDIIYDDGCHYLMRSSQGIIVRRSGEYMMCPHKYSPFSIYRYKQYILIINYDVSRKLIVIDTENKLIATFSVSSSNLRNLTEYRILYFFYPIEKHGKLIFIHNTLDHMIILNETKIRQVIDIVRNDRKVKGCGEFHGYDVIDTFNMDYICEGYSLYHLLLNSLKSMLDFDITGINLHMVNYYIKLHILGHYFDNQNYSLYFIVKIIQQDIQTVGVLVWYCLDSEVRFKSVCYTNSNKNNVAINISSCKFKKLTKEFRLVNNMNLYEVIPSSDGFGKFESLYFATNKYPKYPHTNRFVDVEYNRFSQNLWKNKIDLMIYRIENLILLKHRINELNRQDDGDIDIDSSFCFILSQLQLVEVMQHVVV